MIRARCTKQKGKERNKKTMKGIRRDRQYSENTTHREGVYVYVYMYMCIYVCIYLYMYIYLHIHM